VANNTHLFLRVHDVARLLRVSDSRVYQLCARREIPNTRLGGRVVIPRAAFKAWLKEKTVGALALNTGQGGAK